MCSMLRCLVLDHSYRSPCFHQFMFAHLVNQAIINSLSPTTAYLTVVCHYHFVTGIFLLFPVTPWDGGGILDMAFTLTGVSFNHWSSILAILEYSNQNAMTMFSNKSWFKKSLQRHLKHHQQIYQCTNSSSWYCWISSSACCVFSREMRWTSCETQVNNGNQHNIRIKSYYTNQHTT